MKLSFIDIMKSSKLSSAPHVYHLLNGQADYRMALYRPLALYCFITETAVRRRAKYRYYTRKSSMRLMATSSSSGKVKRRIDAPIAARCILMP